MILKYRQLYLDLKDHILEGVYSIDEPLPSVRKLSKELSLSRTTVENAYAQLLLEGYVYSVQGVGYFINVLERMETEKSIIEIEEKSSEIMSAYAYDYRNEYVSGKVFDLNGWKKHLQHVVSYEKEALYRTYDSLGEMSLRKAVSNYIAMARSIYMRPEFIYIGAGIQTLLMKLLPILLNVVDGLVIEDPGFKKISQIFQTNQMPVIPIPLLNEAIDIHQLKDLKKKICYVSPAHQFPTGQVMKIEQRYALLEWARETDSYIIEDDYNAELRYELFPVPSLKSMDTYDRVIYLGSFSTYLMPSIRISYMILPKTLRKSYLLMGYSQTAGTLEQLAFARMIETGDFGRHVNRLKKHYAKKSESLIQLIEKIIGDEVTIYQNYSGYNLMIGLTHHYDEVKLVNEAAIKGLGISGINEHCYIEKLTPTILMNYRGIPENVMEKSILILAEIMRAY